MQRVCVQVFFCMNAFGGVRTHMAGLGSLCFFHFIWFLFTRFILWEFWVSFSYKVRSLIRMLSNAYEFYFYTFSLLNVLPLCLANWSCLLPADVHLYVWLTLLCILVGMHSRVRVKDVSRERRDCRGSLWTQPWWVAYRNAQMSSDRGDVQREFMVYNISVDITEGQALCKCTVFCRLESRPRRVDDVKYFSGRERTLLVVKMHDVQQTGVVSKESWWKWRSQWMLLYLSNLLCFTTAQRYSLQLAESVNRDGYVYWIDLDALDGRSVYESRYQHSPTRPRGYGSVFGVSQKAYCLQCCRWERPYTVYQVSRPGRSNDDS